MAQCKAVENGVQCERDSSEGGGGRGYCRKHYKRMWRYGTTDLPPRVAYISEFADKPYKKCKVCGEIKDKAEFGVNKDAADGHRNQCKACVAERSRAKYAADYNGMKAKVRNNQRKHRYGLTEAEYDELLFFQGGKCGLCGGPPGSRGFCVDHDADLGYGQARGILCNACNVAIGLLRHDVERLHKAIDYLENPLAKRWKDERKEVTHG